MGSTAAVSPTEASQARVPGRSASLSTPLRTRDPHDVKQVTLRSKSQNFYFGTPKY